MPSVLITGCDTGLGVEFARQYAADGYRVFATCLDPDTAKATRAINGDVRVLKLDVSDLAAIDTLAGELRTEPIDILLSNAGIGRPHPLFGKTDYAQWQRILDVNLIGPMKLAEAFVEHVAASQMKVMAFVSSRMGSIALNARAASRLGQDRTGGTRRCGPQRGRHARHYPALQPARNRLLFRFQRYDAALVNRVRIHSPIDRFIQKTKMLESL